MPLNPHARLGGLLVCQEDIREHVDFPNSALAHLGTCFEESDFELLMAWASEDDFFAIIRDGRQRGPWRYEPRARRGSVQEKFLLYEHGTSISQLRTMIEAAREKTNTSVYPRMTLLDNEDFVDMLEDTADLLQGRPAKRRWFRPPPRPERLYGRIVQLS